MNSNTRIQGFSVRLFPLVALSQNRSSEAGLATAKHSEGLQATVRAILPKEIHRLNTHHDASCDADLARAIYRDFFKRSKQ